MSEIKAECHCGNIIISVKKVPEKITSCNCSICRRYAALWAYYHPNDVEVKYKNDVSTFYIWGDREIEFHRCTTCGCITHYVSVDKLIDPVFAINTRMMDPKVIEKLPIRYVNGASS
jgi:hypothetical protein